jgi:hypothetical protein
MNIHITGILRLRAGIINFSRLQSVQTGYEAHPLFHYWISVLIWPKTTLQHELGNMCIACNCGTSPLPLLPWKRHNTFAFNSCLNTRSCQQYTMMSVVIEMQQWVPFALLSKYKLFRTAVNNIIVLKFLCKAPDVFVWFLQILVFTDRFPWKSSRLNFTKKKKKKSVQWELRWYIRTNGRTGLTQLICDIRDSCWRS